jgi:hypothetical protein
MWHIWGEKRNAYKILVQKYEGKRPLDRPRHIKITWILNKLNAQAWTGPL